MAEFEDDGAAQLLVAFSAAAPPSGGAGGASGAGRLRCLDPSHEAACGRCASAPPLGDEQQYELVGDPGRKNGEKLLKSLLSRTPEWRSPDERAAAARACDATGHGGLARVMRGLDTSAALRKRDMLYLARIWHYRSYLWRPRVSRRRGEGRAEAAATHQAAVVPRGAAPRTHPAPPAQPLPPPLAALGLADLPPLVKLLLPMLAQQHAHAAHAALAQQQQQAAAHAAYIQLLLSGAAAQPAGEGQPGDAAAQAAQQLAALPPHVAALLAALQAGPPQPQQQPVQPDFAAAMAALGHAAPAV